jgi:hypothetical protein
MEALIFIIQKTIRYQLTSCTWSKAYKATRTRAWTCTYDLGCIKLGPCSNFYGKLLHVLVVFDVIGDGLLNDLGGLVAVLVGPLCKELLVGLVCLFLLHVSAFVHQLVLVETYLSSGLELSRVDGVLVETSPLLKGLLCISVVFLIVPVQHAGRVFDTDALAELLQNGRRVVQKIIGINDTNVDSPALLLDVAGLLTCQLGTNLTG